MNSTWRDVDARLRQSRAQFRLVGAACGARDWLADLAVGRPLLAAIDAMPDTPDLRTLLDPLHDTALARLGEEPRAAGDAGERRAEPQALRMRERPAAARSVAATRFAADDGRETRSSVASDAAGARAASARAPARVAALLARHREALRPAALDAAPRPAWLDARTGRRIVPFAARGLGAGEPVPSARDGQFLPRPALLARLGELARAASAPPLHAAALRSLGGIALTPAVQGALAASASNRERASSLRQAEADLLRDTRMSLQSAAVAVESGPPAILRLGDLAAPAAPRDTRANAPVPAGQSHEPGDQSSPSPAGASILGRMAGALARIEERLAAPAPSAEPQTQWLAEDDTLAERIHDILRRQALRHGIDAP